MRIALSVYRFKYDYVLESLIKSLNVYQHLIVEMLNNIIIIIVVCTYIIICIHITHNTVHVNSLVAIIINTRQSKADNRQDPKWQLNKRNNLLYVVAFRVRPQDDSESKLLKIRIYNITATVNKKIVFILYFREMWWTIKKNNNELAIAIATWTTPSSG